MQPKKAAAIREAKSVMAACRQGWKVEYSFAGGKWTWKAERKGVVLTSATEFDDMASAKADFLEAVF